MATTQTIDIENLLNGMKQGARKTINGCQIYRPSAGGFSVTISKKMEHYADAEAAAPSVEAKEHKPVVKSEPKPEPASEKSANRSVKREAKQDLATRVALAIAPILKELDGTIVLEGMTREEAGQNLANWIHHLPVRRQDWPAELPKPDRSNWR
jgi:hypothetical protein